MERLLTPAAEEAHSKADQMTIASAEADERSIQKACFKVFPQTWIFVGIRFNNERSWFEAHKRNSKKPLQPIRTLRTCRGIWGKA